MDSLLLFVPRDTTGILIDKLTGNYGYSHLAIDCGDYDTASGKRLMIEATQAGVHNAFQDKYGERKFIRIPLKQTGIHVRAFCDCVRAKLGETYDDEEALTLGVLDNPAKQICSDLVTVCLPEEIRTDIAHRHSVGNLHPLSAVRVYGKLNSSFRLFVSPNGFAEYFAAPRGKDLKWKDQLAEPVMPAPHAPLRQRLSLGITILGGLALAWFLMRRKKYESL